MRVAGLLFRDLIPEIFAPWQGKLHHLNLIPLLPIYAQSKILGKFKLVTWITSESSAFLIAKMFSFVHFYNSYA